MIEIKSAQKLDVKITLGKGYVGRHQYIVFSDPKTGKDFFQTKWLTPEEAGEIYEKLIKSINSC